MDGVSSSFSEFPLSTRALTFLIFAIVAVVAIAPSGTQPAACPIETPPIKPIPPIGCRDLSRQCACDSQGKCQWVWVCVPAR